MPTCKLRSKTMAPSARIRKPTSGNTDTLTGKTEMDGRKQLAAGTTNSAIPKTLVGPAVVVRTYGS